MHERIDPPGSPSQSSRKGITRLTALVLLDDPENKKQNKLSSSRRTAGGMKSSNNTTAQNNHKTFQLSDRKQPPLNITRRTLSRIESVEDDDDDDYEKVSFHNSTRQSYNAATAENCFDDDLTNSTDATPSSTNDDVVIQQYKQQRHLGGRRRSYEKRRQEGEIQDDLLQFEKDMAGLDLKLTMTIDSDHSEEDLEMQPPHARATYQKLVGPIGPSQKSNWKKSLYFLPCLIVLIVFIIVTPVIREDRKEKSSAELVPSSTQPAMAPPTLSPSRIEVSTLAPSMNSQSPTLLSLLPQSSLFPTLADTERDSSQCSAAEFPPSNRELDLIFLSSSFSVDYCTTSPEKLATFQRLDCVGIELEYRPVGFVPNHFRNSDRNPF